MQVLLLRVALGPTVLAAVLAATFRPVEVAAQEPPQKRVLVLYSSSRSAQIVSLGDTELPRILRSGEVGGVDYYSEFIDTPRYEEGDYHRAFRQFLKLKYEGHAFDLIVAMDYVALQFVDQNRAALFADTPVVFFSSRLSTKRIPNSTGLSVPLNFRDTLTLALALQPDLRHVFVISGADRSYEDVARPQFESFEPQLSFTYLSNLPTDDLERRLAALPEHSIVYYLHVIRDGANANFNPLQYLARVSAVANVPTYCWIDTAMDRGIVGGNVRTVESQLEALGDLALRVLSGETADSIPVQTPDLNVYQVDWRQLRRWGLSEGRLPAGTIVRFRELSVWDRYKVSILFLLAILVAQSTLIAGLLLQRGKRRQAEKAVLRSQEELQTSYERIRDLLARLLTAQETERSRIARELHDDVSQQMALLAIDLGLLTAAVPSPAGELASEALSRTQRIARSVHELSHRLHPAKLRLIGLVAALDGLRQELAQPDLAIAFTHENVPSTLPPDLPLCLFRITQEALQNAIKYSHATRVSMHLRGTPEGLALTIADDGVGFDVERAWGKGLGLISMGERLEAVGGTLEIRSRPGGGTSLEITAPFHVALDTETVAV